MPTQKQTPTMDSQEILSRDVEPHPPGYFSEINVFSARDRALVDAQDLNHPAEHAAVDCQEAEREVQPMSKH